MENNLDTLISWIQYNPHTRGVLEYKSRLEFGWTPREFTKKLVHLKRFKHEFAGTPYYCGPRTTPRRHNEIREMILVKNSIFTAKILGPAGELYARSLYEEAGYPGIPRLCNMGKFCGEIKPDLLFETMVGNVPMRVLIEAKDCRECFYPYRSGENIFRKLIQDAQTLAAQPILVIAQTSVEGENFCRENGIALIHLGLQIVPAKYRAIIHALEGKGAVLYPGECLLVPQRVFQNKNRVSEETWRHLALVQDHDRILEAHKIWVRKWANRQPCPMLLS